MKELRKMKTIWTNSICLLESIFMRFTFSATGSSVQEVKMMIFKGKFEALLLPTIYL